MFICAGDTLGDETSTSRGIDPVVYRVLKGTRIIIKYARRAFRLHNYFDLSVTDESYINETRIWRIKL